ncbi:MAG: Type 1 glutamine amidotransferase-like domain-containing protein [Planctomycetota bacterium]
MRRKSRNRRIALLGPQHQTPTLRTVLDEIEAEGPFALVSAGWQERESETGALEEHLGAPVTNLDLWPATEDAFEADHVLRQRMFDRFDRMRDLARVYGIRLAAELDALRALLGRTDPAAPDEIVGPALGPAFEALEALDAHHASRVAEVNDEVFAAAATHDVVKRERDRVARLLDGAGTLLVAGGHVGIMYNRMRMFGVHESLRPTTHLVGWSAGAMVLTQRILLFHDSPPQGPGDAEIHGPGFGLARGIVALPHAGTRLALDDRARVALLARRLAPDLVVALDDGQSVTSRAGGGWELGGGARALLVDGSLVDAEVDEAGAPLEGAR